MKNKIMFIISIAFLMISCGKSEPESVEPVVKTKKIVKKIVEPETIEIPIREDTNPISDSVSDEVYKKGIAKFYAKNSMFTEAEGHSSGGTEELELYVKNNFKITMLVTQGKKSSTMLYYPSETGKKRIVVTGTGKISIGKEVYYIKTFKDHVEIKQRSTGKKVPLYLRER
jgi:hypothetical protein